MPGDFYAELKPVEQFRHLAGLEHYRPVPDDTVLFLGDVVGSTGAIGEGRYKEVNVAAAAVIAAIGNALPDRRIPFSFGGDGAAFALPAILERTGREALAGAVGWVEEALGLEMRAAAVPVAEIRSAGLDLRLARFAITPDLSYAMFAGGGLSWAEAQMKTGHFPVRPTPETPPPDLSGLSCRFASLPARNGVILSLIVVPATPARLPEFPDFVLELLSLAQRRGGDVHPIHPAGLKIRWKLRNVLLEARAGNTNGGARKLAGLLGATTRNAAANVSLRFNRRIGRFDPGRYRSEIVRNTDFRKFDDGLRMTLDCSPQTADEIEILLNQARADGLVAFGTHRQGEAMLTCFVPSPTASGHVHFIDGAAGGYAFAAQAMKAQVQADAAAASAGGPSVMAASGGPAEGGR